MIAHALEGIEQMVVMNPRQGVDCVHAMSEKGCGRGFGRRHFGNGRVRLLFGSGFGHSLGSVAPRIEFAVDWQVCRAA